MQKKIVRIHTNFSFGKDPYKTVWFPSHSSEKRLFMVSSPEIQEFRRRRKGCPSARALECSSPCAAAWLLLSARAIGHASSHELEPSALVKARSRLLLCRTSLSHSDSHNLWKQKSCRHNSSSCCGQLQMAMGICVSDSLCKKLLQKIWLWRNPDICTLMTCAKGPYWTWKLHKTCPNQK